MDQAEKEGPKPQTAVYFHQQSITIQVRKNSHDISKKVVRSIHGSSVRRAAHSVESGSLTSSFLPLDWPPSVGRWPPFNTWVSPPQVFLVPPITALGRPGFVAGCWPPAVYPGLDSPE